MRDELYADADDRSVISFNLDEIIVPAKKKKEEEEEEEEIDDSDLLSLFDHDPTNVNSVGKGVFKWPVGQKKLTLKDFPKHHQPDDLFPPKFPKPSTPQQRRYVSRLRTHDDNMSQYDDEDYEDGRRAFTDPGIYR